MTIIIKFIIMTLNQTLKVLKILVQDKIIMEVAKIKKTISARPFKSFEFHLDNGEIHLVTHPEIVITDTIIAAIDQDGKMVLITPEAVSSIKFIRKSDGWN
ncbi:MAG: hypothetical protein JSW07_19470 [bacterium]|nr:MAG: hypothetical protein JSW07_19470 [bacterium]